MRRSEMRERELEIARLSLVEEDTKRKLSSLFDFFRKYSLIEAFDHEKVVRALYDSRTIRTLTSICKEEHIDDKTLYRYRKIYYMIYEYIDKETESVV